MLMKDKVPKYNENESVSDVRDERTGSSFGAYFNIVCAVAGTGTLGLPYAVKVGGWLTLLIFALVAILAIYTSKLLIECLYYKPGTRLEDFPDIGEAAFGKFGRYFVKTFHSIILLSCSCIYILLTGINIHALIIQFNGEPILSQKLWILISGIAIILPCILCKTLKEVALLATFGTLATIVLVICVLILGGVHYFNPENIPAKTDLFNLEGFPIALVTIAFSYGGNVVYPQVEATMRYPQSWNKVLLYSVITITLLYSLISGMGYLYYGNDVRSPILEVLPPVVGTQVSYVMITLHVILATPIYLCAFCYDVEKQYKINRQFMSFQKELIIRALFRGFLGAILIVVAMYVPFFEDLTALVGAFSDCLIVFVIPVACHYKLFGFRNRKWWEYILSLISIVVGLLGLILGSKDAITNLILDFQGKK